MSNDITQLSLSARRAIRALREADCTVAQLAEKTFITTKSLHSSGVLKALRKANLVHICAWRRSESNNCIAVYRYGKGKDAERPKLAPAERAKKTLNKIEAYLLENGPADERTIAAGIGMKIDSLRSFGRMRQFVEVGRGYICGWRSNHPGPYIPIFAAGEGESVPRPPKTPNAERLRFARARRKMRQSGGSVIPHLIFQISKRPDQERVAA